MKIILKILNALGAFLASLLCPVLISLLITTPIVAGACALAQPKTLTGILDMEIIDEFTEMYLEDATAILSGERETSAITSEALLDLYDKHAEDILKLVKTQMDEADGKSDEELLSELRSFVEKNVNQALESLPKTEQLVGEIADSIADSIADTEMDIRDIGAAFTFIQNSLIPLLIGVAALLSLIIFGLRAYHLEGTMWLGAIYLLCSGVSFAILGASDALSGIATEALSELGGGALVDSILGTITTRSGTFGIAYLVIGVAMTGAFIAVRVFLSKKKKAALAAAEASAAEASAAEASAAEASAAEASATETAAETTDTIA